VNNNLFSRPSRLDLESWNNSFWTYEATLDAWKAIENCSDCSDFLHHGNGSSGKIVTNTFQPPSDTLMSKIKDSVSYFFNVSFDPDLNDNSSEGIGWMARNLDVVNGEPVRQDSYTKFLLPVITRKNLVVRSGALVSDIELNGSGGATVKYLWRGRVYSAKAKKEVIISAGAMHSPRLLMLSGIGNCSELGLLNIRCQVDSPQVGKNFKDSIATTVVFAKGATDAPSPVGAVGAAYYKSPEYSGKRMDMEISFGSIGPIAPGVNSILFLMSHLLPESSGEIKLRSSNPNIPPLFSFNFYPTLADVAPLVDMYKRLRSATNNTGMFEIGETARAFPPYPYDDEVVIGNYFLSKATSLYHVVGACSMNKVVDGRLRLINGDGDVIPGIRIADNSIIPTLLSTHSTSSAAMLIGMRCSELIKKDWSLN
jgi:choline dehydrogenase